MWRKYHVITVYFLSQLQRWMGMIRSAKEWGCNWHYRQSLLVITKNTSYVVNFTDNHTRSTLSSSLHIFLAKNNVVSWLNVQWFVLQKQVSRQIGRNCLVRHGFVQCTCQSKCTILYKIMAQILIGLIKQVSICNQPSLFNNNTKNTAPNRPMFDRFTQISRKKPSFLSLDS